MDPMPISAYKMGRILRKDEQWVASLEAIMTPEEKAHLQELLKGTPNQYGGTMAPSATKIYEFEESIYERKIQKDKETQKNKEAQYEKRSIVCEQILSELAQMSREHEQLTKQIEHNTRHIEQLTSNAAQLTNQVDQLMDMVSQLIQIEYNKNMQKIKICDK